MSSPYKVTATIRVTGKMSTGSYDSKEVCGTAEQLASAAIGTLFTVKGEAEARQIVDKLLTWHAGGPIPDFFVEQHRHDLAHAHIARQYSDQMICSCGVAWDVNDPDPPAGH